MSDIEAKIQRYERQMAMIRKAAVMQVVLNEMVDRMTYGDEMGNVMGLCANIMKKASDLSFEISKEMAVYGGGK